jgi:hypothetical protein
LGFLFYLFFNYPFELFGVVFAAYEKELAKATLEASNVKISNIDQAIRYGTEAGIFTTFVASTSKLAKTSYLPLGGKIAVSIGGRIIGLGVFIGDKDFYIISKEGVEVLNWDLFIHLGLIILIINVIIFITMKYLSDYDI